MKRIIHTSLCLLFVAVALCLEACNNDSCSGNSSGIPLAAFYSNDKAVSVSNLTVYGIGAPNDSVIIDNTSASQVYMPFRLSTNSCKYVLDLNIDGIDNDTITFNYEAIPYFESHECGAMYNFKIKSTNYTTNFIDSIVIPNPMITNDDVVSIKIYI